MIQGKFHTTFDEVSYDIHELADLYWSEMHCMVKRYGDKMKWDPAEKKQAWAQGMNAVAHADFGVANLTDWEPIKRIYDRFNLPDVWEEKAHGSGFFHKNGTPEKRQYRPNDVDLIVYEKDYLFVPHVDYKQNCVMMLPIWPLDGGTPVKYHRPDNQVEYVRQQISLTQKKTDELYPPGSHWEPGMPLPSYIKFRHMDPYEDVEEYIHYSTQHPTLINGRHIHSIGPVVEDIRVYLRFKFLPPITYDGIVDLHRQGKWIKP